MKNLVFSHLSAIFGTCVSSQSGDQLTMMLVPTIFVNISDFLVQSNLSVILKFYGGIFWLFEVSDARNRSAWIENIIQCILFLNLFKENLSNI